MQGDGQVEGTGDTDDARGEPGGQQEQVQDADDRESNNRAEVVADDYTEISTNLKRRRTYAYGRDMHARL